MNKLECVKCGCALRKGAKFCGKCGAGQTAPVARAERCSKCGAERQPSKRFCRRCGTRFERDAPVEAAPAAPVPYPVRQVEAAPEASPLRDFSAKTQTLITEQSLDTEPEPLASEIRHVSRKRPRIALFSIAVVCAVLAICGVIAWRGATVTVQTNAAFATVTLDGHHVGLTGPTEVIRLFRVRMGKHTITVTKDNFEKAGKSFSVGPLSRSAFVRLQLQPEAAVAHSRKPLPMPAVPAAPRPVVVDSDSRAAEALARAKVLFDARRYSDALQACDEVLRSDPRNTSAARLKAQIEGTMRVLGIAY